MKNYKGVLNGLKPIVTNVISESRLYTSLNYFMGRMEIGRKLERIVESPFLYEGRTSGFFY